MEDFVPFVENPETDKAPQKRVPMPGNHDYEWNVPGDGCWEQADWKPDPAYKDEPYKQPGYVTPSVFTSGPVPCYGTAGACQQLYTTSIPDNGWQIQGHYVSQSVMNPNMYTTSFTAASTPAKATDPDDYWIPLRGGDAKALPGSEDLSISQIGTLAEALRHIESLKRKCEQVKEESQRSLEEGFEECYQLMVAEREKHKSPTVGTQAYQDFLDAQRDAMIRLAADHRVLMAKSKSASEKHLKLMDDAATVYRLTREDNRRVFTIDVGDMSPQKAEMFLDRLRDEIAKRKKWSLPPEDQIAQATAAAAQSVKEDGWEGVACDASKKAWQKSFVADQNGVWAAMIKEAADHDAAEDAEAALEMKKVAWMKQMDDAGREIAAAEDKKAFDTINSEVEQEDIQKLINQEIDAEVVADLRKAAAEKESEHGSEEEAFVALKQKLVDNGFSDLAAELGEFKTAEPPKGRFNKAQSCRKLPWKFKSDK